MKNPWIGLPSTPPFIAPVDASFIDVGLDNLLHLRFEVQPDPFLGNLDEASVVVLALNPGFEEEDLVTYRKPEYSKQNRLNLLHESTPLFYVLNENLAYSGGYKWWTRILKQPLTEVSLEQLSRNLMCIQYFPYHSVTYTHFSPVLPSQKYSFQLVEEAIHRGKTIIVMRSEKLWLEAVPALKEPGCIKLKKPRNPALSPNNMEDYEYQRFMRALLT